MRGLAFYKRRGNMTKKGEGYVKGKDHPAWRNRKHRGI